MKKVSVNVKIDEEMRSKLDRIAKKEFRSRNRLIEKILNEYVLMHEPSMIEPADEDDDEGI